MDVTSGNAEESISKLLLWAAGFAEKGLFVDD
jgi:hypothetical protein